MIRGEYSEWLWTQEKLHRCVFKQVRVYAIWGLKDWGVRKHVTVQLQVVQNNQMVSEGQHRDTEHSSNSFL